MNVRVTPQILTAVAASIGLGEASAVPVKPPLQEPAFSNSLSKVEQRSVEALDGLGTAHTKTPTAKNIYAPVQSEKAAFDTSSVASLLAQSIRAQVAPCWNPPVGGRNGLRMGVLVRVSYTSDGHVAGEPEAGTPTGTTAYNVDYARAFAETARRAVLRCQPLKLPPDMYSLWQTVEIYFDPAIGITPEQARAELAKRRALAASYHTLAEKGDVHAQGNLGLAYYNGRGVARDYIQAYKWFSLVSASAAGSEVRNQAIKNRDIVAAKMSRDQIAEAQRLASAWRKN